ncbi:MAG: hypothetical protein JO306_00105 [Gemmatimonadetes bacterium]|nr:hypothetical protein [Gemmatimonadota bacterium]
MRLIPTLLLLAAALPRPGAAQEASSPEVTRFVARLKSVTASRDRAAMARLFHYPASVWTGRCTAWLLAPADLLARYDAIFSPALRRSIARVTRDSITAPLDGGVMLLSDGRIWLGETGPGNALRIITVNPPVTGSEAADRPSCAQTLPPRISTGIAGNYEDRRGREAGCSLEVTERPRGRMRFQLDCNAARRRTTWDTRRGQPPCATA